MKLSTKITDWADKAWIQEESVRFPYGARTSITLSIAIIFFLMGLLG